MSIIVTKSNGTSDVTYVLQSNDGSKKVFRNESAGLTTPEELRITHFLRPSNAKGTDRHQVTLVKNVADTVTGQILSVAVSLQINVPRSADVTIAMIKDLMAQLTSYCNLTANVTSLVNGGTPEGDFNVTGPFNPSIA
jgi:hypothetical protein